MSMRYKKKPSSPSDQSAPYTTWAETREAAGGLRETLSATGAATYLMLEKLKTLGDENGQLHGENAQRAQRAVKLSNKVDELSKSLADVERRIEMAATEYPEIVPEAAMTQFGIFEDINNLAQGFGIDVQMELAMLAKELDMATYSEMNAAL